MVSRFVRTPERTSGAGKAALGGLEEIQEEVVFVRPMGLAHHASQRHPRWTFDAPNAAVLMSGDESCNGGGGRWLWWTNNNW